MDVLQIYSRRAVFLTLTATVVIAVGFLHRPSLAEPPPDAAAPIVLQVDPAYLAQEWPVLPGTPSAGPVDVKEVADLDQGVDAAQAGPNDLISVLVYFDPALLRTSNQRVAVKQLAVQWGGKVRYEYTTVMPNVINLRDLPAERLDELEKMPGVEKVELDEYHPNLVKLDEATPLVRGLQSQISGAGLSADGTGVRVCIADTGIDMDHVMYASRIDAAASYDFANDDSNPDDDHGHGSHVAGIAVGGTGLSVDLGCEGSEPFQGMAPNATLIGVKILNSAGGGTDSDIIAGIDHCANQSPTGGRADVINLSIGTGNYTGICTHSWAVAGNNAVANGVVVVAASGNENRTNSMGSPACGVDVIAVGATYKDNYPNCEDGTSNFAWGVCTDNSPSRDQIVCFSNESDYLDVAAPGSVILSASNAAGGGSIVGQSGTSMASPMVAGLAALILDADPTLSPAEVRQIIRAGAIDMGTPGFDRAYGYGRIDAVNSLNLVTPCNTNGDCDDGLYCNGAETCSAGDCFAGTPPCGSDPCDEATDSCVSLRYEWNMNTNPGWTLQGQWAYGQPIGGGGQHGGADPTSGATGSNVIGYNLSGDYENSLAETHLTSTAINCAGLSNVTLRFRRWLGVEQPLYDHAYVRVSNNGSTWTTVWQNTAEVADTSWTLQEYNISSVADNQPTVYLRWTMGTTDSSWQYCGWNIDDVQIYAAGGGGGPTCSDGIQNQGETRIDCGGPCPACDCTSDAACNNGLYCDGTETCDAFGECQAGTAVNCNDGVSCTADSCNEATDSCNYVPNNALCDDGLFCNGTETCNATLGCQAGTDPCAPEPCNEGSDTCGGSAEQMWVAFTASTSVPGIGTVNDEDIVAYDFGSGTWSPVFDGSDVGLSSLAINGMAVLSSGDILLTFTAAGTVTGLIGGPSGNSVDDSDIVRFTPTSLGSTTAGTFTFYFDGSDVALTSNDEDIDAIAIYPDGRLVISVIGAFSGTGASGQDEDLFLFTATSLGSVTSGSFSLLFDGSDVGLSTSSNEDVDAAHFTPEGTILLSTLGSFSVSGASGSDEDIFEFFPTQLGSTTQGTFAPYADLSTLGIPGTANVNAVAFPNP